MHFLPSIFLLSSCLFLSQRVAAAPAWGVSLGLQADFSPLPSSSLPPPTTALQLVALGLGVQNYTCPNQTAVPLSMGAVANLYDATFLLKTAGPLASTLAPTLTCIADHADTAATMTHVGVHYFNGDHQPNFDLSTVNMYLQGTKLATANAPDPTADCSKGRSGDAPVAWLQLGADKSGMSKGISTAYRVYTTGGSAPSCAGVEPSDVVSKDYAALYFFYA